MFRIEVTLIYAKFSKDLFIIFKVIGLQTKWPRFLAYPVATSKDKGLTHSPQPVQFICLRIF